ncbi:hypothetical protein K501DRAFT_274632 [Backusella circina FSU 941]|nr:hypothetical protein K501DRAFT_274632 [Backusella circina FSU 941]
MCDIHSRRGIQYPFRHYIQYISDKNMSATIALSIISSGICPQLTTLSVSLGPYKAPIFLLTNMPALKNLSIYNGTLNYNDLDIIHVDVPQLESFILFHTGFDTVELNEPIENPATSLAHFSLKGSFTTENSTKLNILTYIAKKYPNMSRLELGMRFDFTDPAPGDKMMDHAWCRVFQILGPRLRTLDLYFGSKGGGKLFRVLDECHCQIQHFVTPCTPPEIVKGLIYSHQVHYIQTLVLDNIDFNTYKWLEQLVVFRELTLSPEETQVTKFNDILTHLSSTIRSPTLKHFYLAIDRIYTTISPIESLSFTNVRFPNLSTLELDNRSSDRKIWHLPTIKLFTLRLAAYYKVGTNRAIVNTSDNNESHIYCLRDNTPTRDTRDQSYHLPYKCYLTEDIDIRADFTLHCYSLRNVYFKK